jgi:hypothetical protein
MFASKIAGGNATSNVFTGYDNKNSRQRSMSVMTNLEEFYERIGAMAAVRNDPQQRDIPRVMEIAKKFGLEFLPPET